MLMSFIRDNECPKRPVTCEYCGDSSLWAEEMDEHLLKCPVKTYKPPPPGLQVRLRRVGPSQESN